MFGFSAIAFLSFLLFVALCEKVYRYLDRKYQDFMFRMEQKSLTGKKCSPETAIQEETGTAE